MEGFNGPLIDAGAESDIPVINLSPHHDVNESDATDVANNGKQGSKKVSFREPLADKIDVSIPTEVCNDVTDEIFTQEDDRKITFLNNEGRRADDVIKIPEISELWWSSVDDGSSEPQTDLEKIRFAIRKFIDHIAVRVFGIFLILLDLVLLVVDLGIGDKPSSTQLLYDGIALALSCVFMTDLLLRIFSYGPREFFRSVWEVIDGVIIVVTFAITVFYTAVDSSVLTRQTQNLARLVTFARLIRVVRVIRIIYSHRQVTESGRRTISQNKRRYRKDGFDLDLTYVTENVIAMSFPSSGLQRFYRNPKEEVRRFFETKHPGKYKVYNLCSERNYEAELFDNRVYRVLIDDHNVPAINDLMAFIQDAREWMSADQGHVMAIHCKGGKGRTGTVVCSWLIDSGKFSTAKEALEYFGIRRTDMQVGETFQGVETASQIRYVGYFEKIKRDFGGVPPPEKELRVTKIVLTSIAGVGRGNGSDLTLQILMQKKEVMKCIFGEEYNCKIKHNEKENLVSCDIINSPNLSGDVKFRFTSSARNLPRGYDDCAFYFWINTGFVNEDHVTLSRAELDNPHKKKTWHIYMEDFSVQLCFDHSS